MSETRQIFCKTQPDELLAEIMLPDGTSEAQWEVAVTGYYCTEHDRDIIPKPPEPLDITIGKILEEILIIKKDVEDLKPKP